MSAERRERKIVTVLFADLVGFTARAESLDPEDVAALLRGYHERLRSELERWGGTVEKFIGDAVMAVFGAPLAREDDPERAVRAALAIREWAAHESEVEVRIAVNSGEALVTLDARPEAGEGMVAGDVVNTAARMQSAAPANGILVGEQTYRATEHVIDYRAAPPVDAKGKGEPVRAWEAVEARSRFGVDVRQHGGAPLVGRTRELDVLTSALERVQQERSPQLVTLVGVPGIGKSRLVWELFQAIDRGDELVFWRQGRSLPYGEGVSFWALAEMVKAQAGILEGDQRERVDEKLSATVVELVGETDAEWVASQLRALVGSGEPAGEREEAFAAWRRFFESLGERRPLVLVFEDLHFADEGLLDFVEYLVEWSSDVPLLVLCTARPELFERRPGWGGGKLNSTTLALSPLTDDDSARLVGALLDRKLLRAETRAALLERAGGNPLYAEQFARLFVERGSVDDLPLPESVHGLIAARLDALPPEEKELLQDAAVVGKAFWSGALRRPPADARALLHALERKEFVRRERRPPSRARRSTSSATRSSSTSRTARSHASIESTSITRLRTGSNRWAVRKTTRSSSHTTTLRLSISHAPPVETPAISRHLRAQRSWPPGTVRLRSTHSLRPSSSTRRRSSSGPIPSGIKLAPAPRSPSVARTRARSSATPWRHCSARERTIARPKPRCF